MVVPLIVAGVASFFGGAYIGTVIKDATDEPDVVINTQTATTEKRVALLDGLELWQAGALGIAGYLIWKKWLK